MTPQQLVARVRHGQPLRFAEVMAVIDRHYHYTPTAFANGLGERRFVNRAGENPGSCKVLAFARLHGLNASETLALFGEHYRHVLSTPDGQDHRNIRTFMVDGWQGVEFFGRPLRPRS